MQENEAGKLYVTFLAPVTERPDPEKSRPTPKKADNWGEINN